MDRSLPSATEGSIKKDGDAVAVDDHAKEIEELVQNGAAEESFLDVSEFQRSAPASEESVLKYPLLAIDCEMVRLLYSAAQSSFLLVFTLLYLVEFSASLRWWAWAHSAVSALPVAVESLSVYPLSTMTLRVSTTSWCFQSIPC